MVIGNLSATNTIKAIKTKKALNVSIAGKTIVFLKFLALYSCRAYPGSL
jgi:hypothetical protein